MTKKVVEARVFLITAVMPLHNRRGFFFLFSLSFFKANELVDFNFQIAQANISSCSNGIASRCKYPANFFSALGNVEKKWSRYPQCTTRNIEMKS